MGFLRRFAGFLGLANKEETNKELEEEEEINNNNNSNINNEQYMNRKGFSVAVPVAVDRANTGPVIIPCALGTGGIQGLRWYARRLRVDEDGDVADEFLSETFATHLETLEQHERFPRFEVKYNAVPAKVRSQVLGPNGRVQQSVEFKGKLQWV